MMRHTLKLLSYLLLVVAMLLLWFYVHESGDRMRDQTAPATETVLSIGGYEDGEKKNDKVYVHENGDRMGNHTAPATKTVSLLPGYDNGEQINNHNVDKMSAERSVEEINRNKDGKSLALHESVQEDLMRCSLSLGLSEQAIEQANKDTAIMSQKVAEFLQVFWSVIPKPDKFLASYKSPCWYSNLDYHTISEFVKLRQQPDSEQARIYYAKKFEMHASAKNSTLLCLPYFFLPGFSKTGTSTLHYALMNHPVVESSRAKEPHWWGRLPMQNEKFDGNAMKSSIARYLDQFIPSAMKIATHPNYVSFDGSTSSLDSAPYWLHYQDYCIVPALISRVLPNAKIIILMRNPSERTFSNYLFACTQKYGRSVQKWPLKMRQSAADVFHEQVVQTIHGFERCLQNNTLFECVNWNFFQSGGLRCGEVGFRLTVGLYYIHISKWLQFFSREQFLFLKTEEMSPNPYEFLTQITQFLSLSPPTMQQAQEWFQKEANTQKFVSELPQSQMKEETRQLLEKFFKPYNAMLAELVGDERFLWMN